MSLKTGDCVWVLWGKGKSPWPGRITDDTDYAHKSSQQKTQLLVVYFGSGKSNYENTSKILPIVNDSIKISTVMTTKTAGLVKALVKLAEALTSDSNTDALGFLRDNCSDNTNANLRQALAGETHADDLEDQTASQGRRYVTRHGGLAPTTAADGPSRNKKAKVAPNVDDTDEDSAFNNLEKSSAMTILREALIYIENKDLCNVSMVCKEWHDFIQNETPLWHDLTIRIPCVEIDVTPTTQLDAALKVIKKRAAGLRSLSLDIGISRFFCGDASLTKFQTEFKDLIRHNNFPQLSFLMLSNCYFLDLSVMNLLVTQMPVVETLYFEDCDGLQDECLILAGKRFEKLESLFIQGCLHVTDAGLRKMFAAITPGNIKTVDIFIDHYRHYEMPKDGTIMQMGRRHGGTLTKFVLDSDGLHDRAIVDGIALCHNLKVLIISMQETDSLTDKSLAAISSSLKELVQLSIHTAKFTSAGLRKFFTSSPSLSKNLEYLCIDSVPGLNQRAALALAANFTALSRLSLVMCGAIEDAGFIAIGKKCDKLEEVHITGDESVQLKAKALKDPRTATPLFPSLKKFDLDDCDPDCVDKEFLNIIAQRQPNPVPVVRLEGTRYPLKEGDEDMV